MHKLEPQLAYLTNWLQLDLSCREWVIHSRLLPAATWTTLSWCHLL